MGKKKGAKKGGGDDYWDEAGDAVPAAATNGTADDSGDDAAPAPARKSAFAAMAVEGGDDNDDDEEQDKGSKSKPEDDEDFGGLMSAIKKSGAGGKKDKKKGKKNKKQEDDDIWDELGEDVSGNAVKKEDDEEESKAPVEGNLDDEFPDPKAGKKKGGKPKAADDEEEAEKGSGTATPQPAADEDDGTPKILTKKEKEKLKKEREKEKKRAQAAAKKAAAGGDQEGGESPVQKTQEEPAAEESAPPKTADDEDEGDEEGGAGGADKKKKKKKKKSGAEAKAETPAPSAGGKKPSAALQALQARIAAQKKAEEEARAAEEEAKRREEEAERLEKEEAERKEAERQRKKEKEKEKREQLRREGKLLTPKQKAEKKAAEARMQALLKSGQVKVDGLAKREPDEAAAAGEKEKKRPLADNRKKKKFPTSGPPSKLAPPTSTPPPEPEAAAPTEEKAPSPEPAASEAAPTPAEVDPAAADVDDQDDAIKDDWDAESDDGVKDEWDAESDDGEKEAKVETKKAGEKEKGVKEAAPASAASAAPNGKSSAAAEKARTDAKAASEKAAAASAKATKEADAAKAAAQKEEEEEEDDDDDESEDDSGSDSDGSDDDSDDDDSDDSDEDEGTVAQRMAAQRKAEAEKRRKEKHEAALAARNKDDLRSPICCIMGHVDTGKTKLLDKIRQTNVQEGEAGGITQQIGATYFPVDVLKQKIMPIDPEGKQKFNTPGLLVIDTPGHESFTNLRTRGSSLCNIAILVVDIMHGLEPQTLESIRLLRDRKTPFIVALNKIDRLYGWQPTPDGAFRDSLAKQSRATQSEFEDRAQKTIIAFAEQGLNAVLYYDNKNFAKNVSLVPTSAHTGEGIPDMLQLLVNLTQDRMSERLMYLSELECTVLEVKVIEGLGTTIDVILSNGVMHEGDKIVLCGLNGPIVTQVRALLTPQPLKEMRVKGSYVHHKTVKAALGVKISAPDLEKAISGSRLMVCGPDDDEEELKEEVMSDLTGLLHSIDKSGKGVCVQASTLGSLEALLEFLKQSKIPVNGINIGPVYKRDVMRCATMLEKAPDLAVMLCFDVDIDKDASRMAEELGVKIFSARIIYHLFDSFIAHQKQVLETKQKENTATAVWPCRLKILAAFAKRSPLILGCEITAGDLRMGTPICVRKDGEIINLGRVTSLEVNHKRMDIVTPKSAGAGVAVRIECAPHETARTYGRHFDESDELFSHLTRQSIDTLKELFWDQVSLEQKKCIKALKPILNIP